MLKLLFFVFTFSSYFAFAKLCTSEPLQIGFTTAFTVPNGYIGQCGLSPQNGFAAALTAPFFQRSESCGRCIEVIGSGGSLVVPVIDQYFFNGSSSDIDLTAPAFTAVTGQPTPDGRFLISWKFVECPVVGKVQIQLENSNPFFLKIRPQNHRYGVRSMEIRTAQGIEAGLSRSAFEDNAFIYQPGSEIQFPALLKITDIYGRQVELTLPNSQSNIVREANFEPNGGQFPFCNSNLFQNGFE